MLAWLSRMILKITGWKIEGDPANHLKKKLYIVAPHTSNLDFFLGMLVKTAKGVKVNFLGKESLFNPPLGWFLRRFGLLPVKKNSNLIEEIINLYNTREEMSYGLAPEGTRSRVDNFKSGFYYIAHGAQVPLILVTFDVKNKIVRFSEPYYVSDDKEKDMAYIENYFAGVTGFWKKDSFRT